MELSAGYLMSGSRCPVPGTLCWVLGAQCQVLSDLEEVQVRTHVAVKRLAAGVNGSQPPEQTTVHNQRRRAIL